MRFFLSFLTLCASSLPASAHWGHVGELAGHGHIIAVGALVGAAALAAALLKPKGDQIKDADDTEAEPEAEEEPA